MSAFSSAQPKCGDPSGEPRDALQVDLPCTNCTTHVAYTPPLLWVKTLDYVSTEDSDVFDRTLDKHIANIHQKLGDNPNRPRYSLTVQGVGYKLAP